MKINGLTLTFDNPEEVDALWEYLWGDENHPPAEAAFKELKDSVYMMCADLTRKKLVEHINQKPDVLDDIFDRLESDDIVD